jgi:hypothetical protein
LMCTEGRYEMQSTGLWVTTPNASFSREPERSGGESAGSDSYNWMSHEQT